MNKKELIKAVAASSGLSVVRAHKVTTALLEVVCKQLKSGGNITLLGFGTFTVQKRASRAGFNPATRKPIKIAAKKVIKFKPSGKIDPNKKM